MKKRLLCLLLLLPTLLVGTFAWTGGVDNIKGSTSAATGDWACGLSTGLALGIQTMNDKAEYKVRSKTEHPEDFDDEAHINNQGVANAILHFMYSYPEPDTKDPNGAGTVFILPKMNVEAKYLTTTVEGKWGYTDIGDHYYAYQCLESKSSRPIYQEWDTSETSLVSKLYNDAIAGNIKDVNYFKGYITDKMDHDTARDLIGYIFANFYYQKEQNMSTTYKVDVQKVYDRWEEVYNYNINKWNPGSKEQTVQKICNYASILLSLARILPSENWATYEANIGQFVVGALNGKDYFPVVITAEMCANYRHPDTGMSYVTWMTVAELFSVRSGVAESEFRNAQSGVIEITGLDGYQNMAQAIYKKARASNTRNASDSTFGCSSMIGLDQYGNDATSYAGTICRAMTSLSTAAIRSLRTNWGLSVPHDENTPALWGCGIFGGTEALTVAPQRQHSRDGKKVF